MEGLILKSLRYDPLTGIIIRSNTGMPAGFNDNGYLSLKVKNKKYLAHRIAWLFVYGEFPSGPIDHIDCNRKNNAIRNLRVGSDGINQQNSNKFVGVTRSRGRFKAQISIKGKSKTIGIFDTFDDARSAYLSAKALLHAGCSHWSV